MVLEDQQVGLVARDQGCDTGDAFFILVAARPFDAPVDRKIRAVEDDEPDTLNAGRNAENAWFMVV